MSLGGKGGTTFSLSGERGDGKFLLFVRMAFRNPCGFLLRRYSVNRSSF